MSIEFICFIRVLQIAFIIIFGGIGMLNILNPPKERPSWDWEGDILIGKKAQMLGVFFIILMFIILAVTEHTIIKHIKPNTWECATKNEKLEMLHKDIELLKYNQNKR